MLHAFFEPLDCLQESVFLGVQLFPVVQVTTNGEASGRQGGKFTSGLATVPRWIEGLPVCDPTVEIDLIRKI